jgi:hypothetical protein
MIVEAANAIAGALATGALAKASDIGGKAVTDAYAALKTILSDRYETVTAQDHDPALASEIEESGAANDLAVTEKARALAVALASLPQDQRHRLAIDISDIKARLDIVLDGVVTDGGAIQISGLESHEGSVILTGLSAKN